MSQGILEKKGQLSQEIQASQQLKGCLLQAIRTMPEYFNQLLSHMGNEKVEQFLEKSEQYRQKKFTIEKMKDAIFDEEMKEREVQVRSMNLPDTFRRACLSATCAVCLNKHNWSQIMMLTCGHVFHGHCVKQLRKSQCPECRTEIDYPQSSGVFGSSYGYRIQ